MALVISEQEACGKQIMYASMCALYTWINKYNHVLLFKAGDMLQ